MELAEKREVILIPVEFITRLAITTNTKQTFMCVHPPPYIRMVEEIVLRLPSKALQRKSLFWHISKEINIHISGKWFTKIYLFQSWSVEIWLKNRVCPQFSFDIKVYTVEAWFSGHRFSGKLRFKGHSSKNLSEHFWYLVHKSARNSGKSRFSGQ